MDALQVVSSAMQIVSSMVGAVAALEQASRNIDEAPKRIRNLEAFVSELESLTRRVKQKHVHKLHNSQLDRQMQSLNRLIEQLHPKITKARKIVSKNKVKNVAKIVWSSLVGDSLSKLTHSIKSDLNWWMESQKLTEDVERVIDASAENMPCMLRVNVEQGYPVSNKCYHVKRLLDREDAHRVILIVGLSGIGKSCLTRQVASDPPERFIHGAVELGFGQWCSRAACNGSKIEYHKRLAKKMCRFLVQIGYMKRAKFETIMDLEDVCCLLHKALVGKSILVLLDDVWEQDIVERFAKLYDNDCRYLVTTRNEAVHEITEAEKVEICKDDIKEISKAILLYHSFLSDDELPRAGERLLERCGHHPLTVAVMGKALRKEMCEEKWEKAISNLSTYASCAPGPVSYVNEKESENTLTIFGSFEFSLEAMDEHPRKFFISLASLSWAEPVPESCLEALWSALGQENIFPLIACKLVEGSLLMKIDSGSMYQVHDMVSLYLDSRVNEAMQILLVDSVTNAAASVAPWLSIFGKESVKRVSDKKIKSFLNPVQETEAVAVLESSIQALMASNSISEFEMSRKSFSSTLGPRIADFISEGSPSLIASSTKAITHLFSNDDYVVYFPSLETMVEKLLCILNSFNDPQIITNASTVVSKLAELANQETSDRVLQAVPFDRLSELLAPDTEEWHEGVFTTLMSLTKVGKDRAVERIVASGLDKRLVELLETCSDVAQHNVIIVLKTLYESGGLLRPGMLKLLPWHARHNLERFVPVDRNALISPKSKPFDEILHALIDRGDDKQVLEAMQDLLPMIERVRDPRMRDMILQSPLIERLAGLLQSDNAERTRVESAFVLMKLACMGGERCVREMIERDVVPLLVSMMMMQTNTTELQDAAYAALHQMVFGDGGRLVSDEVAATRNAWVVERLARALESKSTKTREVAAQFVVDLVEAGSKACVERVLASRAVEGLARLERGAAEGAVVGVIKGLEKCKSLSKAERRVMKQAVVRRVRAAVRGQRNEGCVMGAVENCLAEGSREGSSGKHRK